MKNKDPNVEVITYGRELVKFLRGYEILREKAGWFERGLLWLLKTSYQQRLRAIIALLPPEISNQVFDSAEEPGRLSDES